MLADINVHKMKFRLTLFVVCLLLSSCASVPLSTASRKDFRELQAFVAKAKVEDIAIRVRPKLASEPDGAKSVDVWIDLRSKQEEGYFVLVDAATLSLTR